MNASRSKSWEPRYALTAAIVRRLMEIEAARAAVEHAPLPPAAEAELRHRARVRSTHYSTRIEGNRLTLDEAEQVIAGRRTSFAGRARDVSEVLNYWNALLRVEDWAAKKAPLTEDLIRRLHALVERGTRARPSPYRGGQNAIRDSASGAIVYLPPRAKDVPGLMAAMARWAHQAQMGGVPAAVIAALVHYQFVTIHPFYDGNGRTARLLATFVLHRGGYGLHGFLSLEEHHARDLEGYYRSLAVHPHHNYYEGRAKADLTQWLEYFIQTLAGVFEMVRQEAVRYAREGVPAEPVELRRLDRRARVVLGMFAKAERITASEVAAALRLSDRMARNLLREWTADGWLLMSDPSRRGRRYSLSARYRQYVGTLSAIRKP
jgi:Fic family protein